MAGNIALQTMLPKFDSPFEVQGKAMQIQQMQLAQQEAQAQQALQAQARADDAGYRQALQASAGDSTRLLSALASSGNHAGYAKAQAADLAQRKGNADIAKDKATTAKSEWDVLKEANGMVGSAAGALAQQPTYENAQSIVGQLRQRLGPDMSAKLGLDSLEIPQDPAQIKAWADQHYMSAIDADKQLTDSRIKSEGVANRGVQVQLNTATNDRIAKEGSLNRANQIKTSQMVSDRQAKTEDVSQLSPADEKMAQGIAAGKLPTLSSFAMLKPANKAIMARALDINPNYDAGDYLAKNKALRDFSTGTQGLAVQAANTGLNHLHTIEELAQAQKNGDLRSFNAIANRLAAETGSPAPTNLAAAITMVAPEVSKMVIGAAGGQEERATFAKNFNPNASPEQTIGGIGTIRKLLGGRLTEAERTYKRTTGRKNFGDEMLSPAAQAVLQAESPKGAAPAPAPPKAGTVQDGWRFKGGDASNKSNWEKT